MVMRSSRRRSHPIVASDLLSGLAFYRAGVNEVARSPTVQRVLGTSASPSPLGKAELYLPAWARDRWFG
jgi:hypothetical protein